MNGGKEYKASRLGGLERVRRGEKVIIRTRERKEEKAICSSRLSRSCFTLSRAYESCLACQTLISTWQKTTRISCHNCETNGRPWYQRPSFLRPAGYLLSPNYFQKFKWMPAPDWARKMLCIIVFLSSFREFVHDGYCLATLAWFVHQACACKGNCYFLLS